MEGVRDISEGRACRGEARYLGGFQEPGPGMVSESRVVIDGVVVNREKINYAADLKRQPVSHQVGEF